MHLLSYKPGVQEEEKITREIENDVESHVTDGADDVWDQVSAFCCGYRGNESAKDEFLVVTGWVKTEGTFSAKKPRGQEESVESGMNNEICGDW